MSTRLIARIALLLLLCSPAMGQQYYRWVDANGTVHFSESPPVNNTEAEAEQIRPSHITRGLSGSADADADTDAANTNAAAETPTQTTQDAQNCAKVRGNLQTLTSSQQVQRVDPDTGESRVMTSAEHQAELERNQRLESAYCF